MNKISDKELIQAIFERLDDNFMDLDNPNVAITESEFADEALVETLYNIGLDGCYERLGYIDDDGIWYAKFTVKNNLE